MQGLTRYAIVGLVATASHYALLILLIEWAAWRPGRAAMAGSILGAIVAYGGNRRYTFAHTQAAHNRAFPRFAVIACVGALANALIVGGGVAAGAHYLLMQALATVLVMLGTYQLNRFWTFGSRD